MAFSGVRNSWLILARKVVLDALAASASKRLLSASSRACAQLIGQIVIGKAGAQHDIDLARATQSQQERIDQRQMTSRSPRCGNRRRPRGDEPQQR